MAKVKQSVSTSIIKSLKIILKQASRMPEIHSFFSDKNWKSFVALKESG